MKSVLFAIVFVLSSLSLYAQKFEPVYDHTGYIKLIMKSDPIVESFVGRTTVKCYDLGSEVNCSNDSSVGMFVVVMDSRDTGIAGSTQFLPSLTTGPKNANPLVELAVPLGKHPDADTHFQYRLTDDWKNPLTRQKESAYCVPYPKKHSEVCYEIIGSAK